MGTGSFLGVKYGRGVLLTIHPLLVLWSWKSRALLLPNLWAKTGPVTGTLYLTYLKPGHGSVFTCLYIISTHFTTYLHYCLYVIYPINFSNSSHLLHHWSSWQGSHVSTIPWSIILIPMSIFRIWKMLKMYCTSKSVTIWLLTYHITHHTTL